MKKFVFRFFFLVFLLAAMGCAAKKDPAPRLQETGLPEKETVVNKSLIKPIGEPLTVSLILENAPAEVRAMGYEVWFNPEVLTFEKYERGEFLRRGFRMFGANVVARGKLRMGGIEPGGNPIKKGDSGELAVLTFKVIGPGDPAFSIREVKDHLKAFDAVISDCTEKPLAQGFILCLENEKPTKKKGDKR